MSEESFDMLSVGNINTENPLSLNEILEIMPRHFQEIVESEIKKEFPDIVDANYVVNAFDKLTGAVAEATEGMQTLRKILRDTYLCKALQRWDRRNAKVRSLVLRRDRRAVRRQRKIKHGMAKKFLV